jgi:hypothetical protein
MIKHLAKVRRANIYYQEKNICVFQLCDIGDASRGTLSSYAYIIMVIHFLQQIQPPVLPVLQQVCGEFEFGVFSF